ESRSSSGTYPAQNPICKRRRWGFAFGETENDVRLSPFGPHLRFVVTQDSESRDDALVLAQVTTPSTDPGYLGPTTRGLVLNRLNGKFAGNGDGARIDRGCLQSPARGSIP